MHENIVEIETLAIHKIVPLIKIVINKKRLNISVKKV